MKNDRGATPGCALAFEAAAGHTHPLAHIFQAITTAGPLGRRSGVEPTTVIGDDNLKFIWPQFQVDAHVVGARMLEHIV